MMGLRTRAPQARSVAGLRRAVPVGQVHDGDGLGGADLAARGDLLRHQTEVMGTVKPGLPEGNRATSLESFSPLPQHPSDGTVVQSENEPVYRSLGEGQPSRGGLDRVHKSATQDEVVGQRLWTTTHPPSRRR